MVVIMRTAPDGLALLAAGAGAEAEVESVLPAVLLVPEALSGVDAGVGAAPVFMAKKVRVMPGAAGTK